MTKVITDGLAFALPLFIIAIGGIYSERSGITNLALEGLLGFGAFFGAMMVVIIGRSNPQLIAGKGIYLGLFFASLGGAIFSLIHALLTIRFKANQVISGVVLNILSLSLTEFLTRQINGAVFKAPSNKFQLGVAEKISIPGLSKLPVIGFLFRDLYPFIPVIIVLALVFTYILNKTRFGMRLKAAGDNPQAVDAAGVDVNKIRFIAIVISGALAGVGGMSFAYSISANFSPSIYAGFGYLAIAGLIFGNWNIGPTLFSTLLFGIARSGGYQLAQVLKMSSTFSDIIMTLPYVLTLVLLIFFSKNNQAPRALGEVYDKGKR